MANVRRKDGDGATKTVTTESRDTAKTANARRRRENVILAVCLISTVSTLTRLKEHYLSCSRERWGSPSELRGTAVRFRLPYSITERTLENTLELLRILIYTSPGWRTILEKTSEDFYSVEGEFWDAIHNDLKLD